MRSVPAQPVEGKKMGHWLRAPFEVGKPHTDGLRSRLVELHIDDLAGLLGQHGTKLVFWLIKDGVGEDPRWVLPGRSWSAEWMQTGLSASG